jgi:hypothetical protein
MTPAGDLSSIPWPGIPYPAFLTAAGVALLAAAILAVSRYMDQTGGLLTISIMLVLAFIASTFASMIYAIPQVPSTEILVGSLATALGAVVAYWLGNRPR